MTRPERWSEPSGRLSPRRVAEWKGRLRALGGTPAEEPSIHLDAARARLFYGFDDDAKTIYDDFEAYMYVQRFEQMVSAACSLRSPLTPVWNERPERIRPPWLSEDDLVVTALLNFAE